MDVLVSGGRRVGLGSDMAGRIRRLGRFVGYGFSSYVEVVRWIDLIFIRKFNEYYLGTNYPDRGFKKY